MVSLLVQLTISHFTVLSNVSHSHLKVHIGVKEYLTRHKTSSHEWVQFSEYQLAKTGLKLIWATYWKGLKAMDYSL